MEKLSIDLGYALLTVEKTIGKDEFLVCLENKETGFVDQDIVLIRKAIDETTHKAVPEAVECIVWADSSTEDYTNKFFINRFVPDDEPE